MQVYDTLEELQQSRQARAGLFVLCRENYAFYIVQESGYTPSVEDVLFANGRYGKFEFFVSAENIKTTGGNVQGDLDSIIAGGLPTQSGNKDKVLTTDGTSASWTTATLQFETVSSLEATTPVVDGLAAVCQERANAQYVLADSGYAALPGDIVAANGRVWQLQLNEYLVDYFGAKPSTSGEPTFDSTSAIQDAINRAASAYSGLASFGCQSPVVELGQGAYLITDTLNNTGNFGHWSILAKNGRESSLVWGYEGADTTKPVIDNGAKGENFRINNVVCIRTPASTQPYCWIKSTTGIDIGFDVDGCSFKGSSEAVIQYAGVFNGHLKNWRCDDTGRYIVKITSESGGASFNRVLAFDDFTFHTRDTAPTAMKAVVGVELSSSDQFDVVFDNNRHEIEDDGIESTFAYVDVSGTTSSSPAITVSFKDFGQQINGSTTKDINIIESSTTNNIFVNVSFFNAIFDKIDNFRVGNINTSTTVWPDASTFSRRMINGHLVSGKTDTIFNSAYIGNGLAAATDDGFSYKGEASFTKLKADTINVSPIPVIGGEIDISSKRGQIVIVDMAGSPTVDTITGGEFGEIIYLRGTVGGGSLSNSGNIRMKSPPVSVAEAQFIPLLYDLNSSTWRVIGA